MGKRKDGITLISLIITIVIMLILAAVAINLIIGKDGLFMKSQKAKTEYLKSATKEEFSNLLTEYQIDQIEDPDVKDFKDYLMDNNATSVVEDGSNYIVNYKDYIFTVEKETLKIIDVQSGVNGVIPDFTVEQSEIIDGKVILTVNVKNSSSLSNIDIKVYNKSNEEISSIENGKYEVVKNGTYTIKVSGDSIVNDKIVTNVKTQKVSVTKFEVAFSTAYGTVDVIWLDTDNNVINSPLSPNMQLGNMSKVCWKEGAESIPSNDSEWYNYEAKTSAEDNLVSRWANAKNNDGSYFVWIPRYAYRITYYASEDSDEETGYCDGRGIVKYDGTYPDGKTSTDSMYKLDNGIETVNYNNVSYIVHPAFATNLDEGGWTSNLSGIWVSKYEMSYSNASITNMGSGTQFKSVPSKVSARNINIGDMYNYAKNIDSTKKSHLMKNSEWGAVAYLTQSQYGRNGHEISRNACSNYITGAGPTLDSSISYSYSSSTFNSTYAYSTVSAQKTSTTGNLYGIYDLSGGSYEYVAGWDKKSTNTSYGNSFASYNGSSTAFATAYINGTSEKNGNKIYIVGKNGDATKECYNNSTTNRSWFRDAAEVAYSNDNCFFVRGGSQVSSTAIAGVFCSGSGHGGYYEGTSFRVVLGE